MSDAEQQATLALADLRAIRRALVKVMDTHRPGSRAATAAAEGARKAYRLAFTAAEKARVLGYAKQLQQEAPAGHPVRQMPDLTTFEQALDEMGTVIIGDALGGEA